MPARATPGNSGLAFDAEVRLASRCFHIMVAIVLGDESSSLRPQRVETSLRDNGEPLPFWHVVLENVSVQAQCGRATT